MKPSPTHLPKRLEFFFGGWDSLEGCNLLFEDGVLWHGTSQVCLDEPGRPDGVRCAVDEKQWLQFWQDIERIGVWDWQPEYQNHNVLDGMFWHLKLKHEGKRLKAEGSNAYPGAPDGPEFSDDCAFGQFLATLRRLTGIKEI